MSSHNFMTGIFRKNKRSSADFVKFYHSATLPQLSILHEISSQHLGHAPSLSWGRQVVPWRFPDVQPETMDYVRQATRQPIHEFARRMTSGTETSKRAGSFVTAAVDTLASAGKVAVKYGSRAVAQLIKHQDSIRTGFKVAKDVADLASTIGLITGAISPDTHKKVTAVTSTIDKTVNRYGKKEKPKKGGWVDYTLL